MGLGGIFIPPGGNTKPEILILGQQSSMVIVETYKTTKQPNNKPDWTAVVQKQI